MSIWHAVNMNYIHDADLKLTVRYILHSMIVLLSIYIHKSIGRPLNWQYQFLCWSLN